MRAGQILAVATLLLIGLGACSNPVLEQAGGEKAVMNKIDDCISTCKRDNNACYDSAAAERTEGRQFGAASQCDRTLKKCFEECRNLDPRYGLK